MNVNILVAGGDLRMKYAADRLAENERNNVYFTGNNLNCKLNKRVIQTEDYSETGVAFDVLVLPAPTAAEGENVYAPYSEKKICLSGLPVRMRENGFVFGGRINKTIEDIFSVYGIEVYDYLNSEEFSIKNAVPTAEGAVQTAMEKIPGVLYGKEVLVTGYGRISRVLSRLLFAFGCSVTVSARKKTDILWASVAGCRGMSFSQAFKNPKKYDLIFNTVPAEVFGKEVFGRLSEKCVYIELASAPGGISPDCVPDCGPKIVRAPGLPGKKSPEAAGFIIADTVSEYITERSTLYE